MRKSFTLFIFLSVLCLISYSQDCLDKKYPLPGFLPETKAKMDLQLKEAKEKYEKNPSDNDALIWYGRRMAYLGNYKDAILLFTKGIKSDPEDARFLRHRAHRYITLRCNKEAIADLVLADELVLNKTDEIEPDGMPNARNIPTSTLKSNIRYHLGLAWFLERDYNRAELAWKNCLEVSDNPDMFVATAYWLYVTLRFSGKEKQAADLLKNVRTDLELIENEDYYSLLLLYKGVISENSLLQKFTGNNSNLSSATTGFALGLYYLISKQPERAEQFFQKVLKTNQWSSFGYIGAEKFSQAAGKLD